MSKKQTPSDFLKLIIGRPVMVKLNSGVDYRGWGCLFVSYTVCCFVNWNVWHLGGVQYAFRIYIVYIIYIIWYSFILITIVFLICDCFCPFFSIIFFKSGIETPDRNDQWHQHFLTLFANFYESNTEWANFWVMFI